MFGPYLILKFKKSALKIEIICMYISLNTGASGCELQVKNKQYYINIGFDEHEQHRFKIISP